MGGVLILNRKQKKELRRRLSTRQLMGIDQLTEHGLKTAKGELVLFLLSPDNLSVLSADGVRNRVRTLTDLLRSVEAAELLALDSRESFQSNKNYYQTRLEQEAVPAIREMLRQNMAHLDDIQSTTASAREFALVHRIDLKFNEDYSTLKQLEKRIKDCGFHVRMAEEQDVKRLLAVYYQQDVTTEHFDNFDGEGSVRNG
jgi:predicted amino acid-binding ACT domain protein